VFAQNDAYFLGFVCATFFGGILIGLLPLLLGLSRGQQGLAWGGFGACVGATFFGLVFLAVPVAILFTILIVAQPKNEPRRRRRRYRDDDDDYQDDYRDRDTRRRFRDLDREARRRYGEDDDRPSRRSRDDEDDRRDEYDDRPAPRRDRENRSPSKQEPPKRGFGYRETEDY
jgi:hypothetical protein